MKKEPQWLIWTREMQAIAQSGLAYTKSVYERERYEQLRSLASKIMSEYGQTSHEYIETLFSQEHGYATPKIDIRGAVFDAEKRLLMVRETADNCWSLPGGWADVNLTPSENIIKEIREESGYHAKVTKLAAAWDRTRQKHSAEVFSCYKLFFIGEVIGGNPELSIETSEIGWFEEGNLPSDLSLGRVLPSQLERMFMHFKCPELPADFD